MAASSGYILCSPACRDYFFVYVFLFFDIVGSIIWVILSIIFPDGIAKSEQFFLNSYIGLHLNFSTLENTFKKGFTSRISQANSIESQQV